MYAGYIQMQFSLVCTWRGKERFWSLMRRWPFGPGVASGTFWSPHPEKVQTGKAWKSKHFLCKQKAVSEVMITLHIPGKWLKRFSFTWEMHFGVVTVQLLGGSRIKQLLEMGSEIKAANVTSLQHPPPGPCQVGSLAGAVHPSNYNAGLLRWAWGGWKHPTEEKGKSLFGLDFQYEYRPRKRGLVILLTFWDLPKTPNIPNPYYVYACKL